MSFRKILITGNVGAGKTTLSKRLGDLLGLPVYNLDQIIWQQGWKKRPQQERDQAINTLITQEAWVIDGVSIPVMDAAELIIFLDFNRVTCLARWLKRSLRIGLGTRPEFLHTTPELFVLPRALQILWKFPRAVRPKILAYQHDPTKVFHHIQSHEELNWCLRELESSRLSIQ